MPPLPSPGSGPGPGPICAFLGLPHPPSLLPAAPTSAEEGDVVIFHRARGLPGLEVHHLLGMSLQQVQAVQTLLWRWWGLESKSQLLRVKGSPAHTSGQGGRPGQSTEDPDKNVVSYPFLQAQCVLVSFIPSEPRRSISLLLSISCPFSRWEIEAQRDGATCPVSHSQ